MKSFKETYLEPWGYVTISKDYSDGSKEIVFEGENLIVNSGKRIFVNQLFYTLGNGNPVNKAKLGVGGALDSEGIFLKIPTADMTNLYSPAFTVPVVKVSENTAIPSITLTAALDNSVGNGSYFNEAGFFTEDDQMFNIKTFPRVLKTVQFSLNVTWEIGVR